MNPEVFKVLDRGYLKDFYHERKYVKKYKGYVVRAIDGSIFEIPNTEKNRNEFGTSKGGKGRKETPRTARALMSGAYDVYNKFFGDIQIDKVATYEAKLAEKNIDECLAINDKLKNNINKS